MKFCILMTAMISVSTAWAQARPVTESMDDKVFATPTGQPIPPNLNLPLQQQQVLPQPMMMPPPSADSRSQNSMQELLPILNAVTSALGGGSQPSRGSERMAGSEGDYGFPHKSGGYVAGSPNTSVDQLNPNSSHGYARVVDMFKKAFPVCLEKVGLGKCIYVDSGVWGNEEHQHRHSCHNSGDAMDVGFPFNCAGGKKNIVQATDPEALEVARCMANDFNNQFGVIFQDRREPPNMFAGGELGRHNGHMHIQVRICRSIKVK